MGRRRIVKPLNDFIYRVEDLQFVFFGDVYVLWLKFYHDAALDKGKVLLHVISSELELMVHRLMKLVKVEKPSWYTFAGGDYQNQRTLSNR